MPETLAIGEVARRSGFSVSAIRYYEMRGLLPEPERESGRRRYEPGILTRLAAIGFARRAGFSLDEIRTLVANGGGAHSERWRALADRKLAQTDAEMRALEERRSLLEDCMRCECGDLRDCDLLAA